MITDAIIRKESKQYDPEIVSRLKLERLSLNNISNLYKCANIVDLSLAWNQISDISGIEELIQLTRLDLSHNLITRVGKKIFHNIVRIQLSVYILEKLTSLTKLEKLDLKANLIGDLYDINELSTVNRKFQSLNLYLKSYIVRKYQ